VPFRDIADLVMKVNAQAFSIEAANPRHEWEWTVWQDVKLPEGKILLPGVISHAISHVEHPELIAQRLRRFTDLVGRENVIASSDCGFAQGAGTQRQVASIQWAKLAALVEGARLASRQPVQV
jgi:5-methyltetrahydropteroyltriglutamate--homocysteine methyltransferase